MKIFFLGLKTSSTNSILHRLDPRIKIISFILLIGAVLLTPGMYKWKFLAYFMVVASLLIISRMSIKDILLRLYLLLPLLIFLSLTLIIFSHESFSKKMVVIYNLSIKSGLIFISFSLLFCTTEFYSFLKGMQRLKVPGIIISVLTFAYRYLFLFLREGQRFKFAWISRSYEKKRRLKKIVCLFYLIPNFLSKVFDRSIRIYAAMLSRGFKKNIPSFNDLSLKKIDYGFAFFFNFLLLGIVVIL